MIERSEQNSAARKRGVWATSSTPRASTRSALGVTVSSAGPGDFRDFPKHRIQPQEFEVGLRGHGGVLELVRFATEPWAFMGTLKIMGLRFQFEDRWDCHFGGTKGGPFVDCIVLAKAASILLIDMAVVPGFRILIDIHVGFRV